MGPALTCDLCPSEQLRVLPSRAQSTGSRQTIRPYDDGKQSQLRWERKSQKCFQNQSVERGIKPFVVISSAPVTYLLKQRPDADSVKAKIL